MIEESSRRKVLNKKVLPLFLIFGLTTLTIIIATYACFIGTRVVNTSTFEESILAIKGLELSLNGQYWEKRNINYK